MTQTRLDERTPEPASQLNPARGSRRGEKGQRQRAALKVRCGDTGRAVHPRQGAGPGCWGVWLGSLAPEAIKFTHASQFNYASVMSLEIPQSKTYGVGRRREDCLV